MTFATIYSYLGTYLAVRKAIAANEQLIVDSKAYDVPCCVQESEQTKGLFLLWCLENIDCYDDSETDKVISVANRWSKNCSTCSVTQAEIDAFKLTDLGKELSARAGLNGAILMQTGTWILQQNGYLIIL
jgi:hypothetical protein